MDVINVQVFGDMLILGSIGLIAGVLLPWAFWLVGRIVKAVRIFTD